MPLLRNRPVSGAQEEGQRQWWEENADYTEKGWKNGWSVDGYPYVTSTAHFLNVAEGTHQSASRVTAPPWAPHYPYVQALQGPSAPSKKKPAESLAEEVEDLMNFGSGHLSAAVIQVLDRLEEAFRSSDPQSMMEAVSELGLRGGFEESLLASRGAELLEASNAERSGSGSGRDRGLKASPNPKLAALEAEILRRFARAFAQQPERSRAFVDEGLPEPLLEPLRRQRMLRAVRAMTAPKSAPVTAPARERSEGSEGSAARSRGGGYSGCQPDHLPAQRAVSSYHLASKDQAQLSQAVLELPWSGNEKWERRWEQDLMWHPGILYGAHQALPQQR